MNPPPPRLPPRPELRLLGRAALDELCQDIRNFLIASISATGGHLGPNLGVVELTVAIHRVFDSPTDAILWDTGHQAYVHKLLTGRADRFSSLRQPGGLSGYPSRRESEHDWVENSHASTALSYAHGLATAWRASTRSVVAVVGDGALTGGMAFEGLNNLGLSGVPCTIVVNDNGRSYAPTASRLWSAPDQRWADSRRARDLSCSLGIRYIGPVDGHNIPAIEKALEESRIGNGPSLVHVRTQKGKGYVPAEEDKEKHLHDTAPYHRGTGRPRRSRDRRMTSFTAEFGRAMECVGRRDDRVHAITAAMPGSTGLLRFADQFPGRFHDVGIAEQHAVGMAAGLALAGQRPVVALFSTFFSRAFDQAYLDVGLHQLPVVFAIDRAGVTGSDGPSHHGLLDMVLALRVPGLTVLAPSSPVDVHDALTHALTLEGPALIRYPKGDHLPGVRSSVPLPAAVRLSAGADVCLVAIGRMLEPALAAAAELGEHEVSTSVWDLRSVQPVDPRLLADAARHRVVLTIEDGASAGGAGEHVLRELSRQHDPTPSSALGVATEYVPHGDPVRIRAEHGLSGPGIAAAAQRLLTASRQGVSRQSAIRTGAVLS